MADIRSFFSPVAIPTPASVQVDPRPAVGRPRTVGSQASQARDSKGRLLPKHKRSRAAHDSDSDSEEEHAKHRAAALRTNWAAPENQAKLQRALDLVQKQNFTLRHAADQCEVPFTVLQRRVSGGMSVAASARPATALTSEQEKELADFALSLAELGFGKDAGELRTLARRMSSNPSFKATRQWWARFMRRHPHLSRRRSQGYERLRASAMNCGVVKQYFLLLTSAFIKIAELSGGMQLAAERVYNMDELGFQLNAVQPYIITRKGTKHTASISYNCRVTTSLAVCVSASGFVLPPFFIVKGKNRPSGYLNAATPGSTFEMAKKGMMTTEVFEKWVEHFVRYMEPRAASHWSLLLLDGHHSHTMNPAILKLLWDNHVYAVALPSHTTAQLQLLDVAVFSPLKRAFRQWIQEWKLLNPTDRLDKKAIPNIVAGIWSKLRPEIIRKGAASTGLYPLNANWAAQNMNKMQMAKTFSQPTLPGSIAFANHCSSMRSLAALDLAMSPPQVADLHARISAAASMPRLNALRENMSQARLLNSEERVRRLFALQDLKREALAAKAEKRKQRGAKKVVALAKRMQKQHVNDAQREMEQPLVQVLVSTGHMESESKPTVSVLRAYAKQLGIKSGTRSRADLIQLLLEAMKTSGDRGQQSAADTKHKQTQSSESDNSEPESPKSSSDDDSDVEDWSDFKIRF
jgi:hypothetical protein